MHASDVTPETIERANELYWHSNRSVNRIADDLDLSKGALYGIITPLPSGLGCPLCGDEVAYPNRTAKERELLDCPTCDWDGSPDETIEFERPTPDVSEVLARERSRIVAGPVPEPWIPGLAARDTASDREEDPDQEMERALPQVHVPDSDRIRTIAGGALLGAAAGLALVLWARRR